MRIDFCCNDPDNGAFSGRVVGVTFGDQEIEADDFLRGYRFKVEGGRLRIERKWFAFDRSKDWIGNWCWNGFWFSPPEGKRLLRHLRSTGRWRCTTGYALFYDWFNRRGSSEAP